MCRSQCQFNVTVEYKLVLTSHLVHERKNDEASWPRHFHKSFRPVVKRFSSCYQSTWFLQISQMIDSFSCSSHIAASVSRPITWKLLSVPNRQSDLHQPDYFLLLWREREAPPFKWKTAPVCQKVCHDLKPQSWWRMGLRSGSNSGW